MTPERLDAIAQRDMQCQKLTQADLDRTWLLDHVSETYGEIERLRQELIDARLQAQEAWDAYDYAIEREARRDRAA